jgi:hypothetical protein
VQLLVKIAHLGLGAGERGGRGRGRVVAGLDPRQLAAGLVRPGEQLVVAPTAEAALRVGDPLELGLDLLETAGLGLERGQERAQVEGRLPQPQPAVAELLAGAGELGRQALERPDRALRLRDQPGRAVAVVGGERLGRGRRPLGELGDVT